MILGLTGSFGAGKGTVVQYLQKKGFKHYSASGFITDEILRRNLVVSRDTMIMVANDLRKNNGPSYIIDSLYKIAEQDGGDAIIESLRAVAEVKKIKELGGTVIGIDAEPEIRYERSVKRGSIKDNVSYDRWREQEKLESNLEDETKQNIFGALKESDFVVTNNGTLEELHKQVEEVLKKIGQ